MTRSIWLSIGLRLLCGELLNKTKQMGKRGPKPADLGVLLALERDWDTLFRQLLHGRLKERKDYSFVQTDSKIARRQSGYFYSSEILKRRDLWRALTNPQASLRTVRFACERWRRHLETLWPTDPLGSRAPQVAYVEYLASHISEFQAMLHDKGRFPRASYSDESRIVFLSRGMAGIMEGRSPATAIDLIGRLRHGSRCRCWRCVEGRFQRPKDRKRSEKT